MVCLKTAPERVRTVFIHMPFYFTTNKAGLQEGFEKNFCKSSIFFDFFFVDFDRKFGNPPPQTAPADIFRPLGCGKMTQNAL